MGRTTEESVDSGQRQEIFLSPKDFILAVGAIEPPINGYNAVMRFWPLKNLAESVNGPTLCMCCFVLPVSLIRL